MLKTGWSKRRNKKKTLFCSSGFTSSQQRGWGAREDRESSQREAKRSAEHIAAEFLSPVFWVWICFERSPPEQWFLWWVHAAVTEETGALLMGYWTESMQQQSGLVSLHSAGEGWCGRKVRNVSSSISKVRDIDQKVSQQLPPLQRTMGCFQACSPRFLAYIALSPLALGQVSPSTDLNSCGAAAVGPGSNIYREVCSISAFSLFR